MHTHAYMHTCIHTTHSDYSSKFTRIHKIMYFTLPLPRKVSSVSYNLPRLVTTSICSSRVLRLPRRFVKGATNTNSALRSSPHLHSRSLKARPVSEPRVFLSGLVSEPVATRELRCLPAPGFKKKKDYSGQMWW